MLQCNSFEMLLCMKIFISLLVIIPVKSDIHNDMSANEIREIFGRSDGSVPNYERVKVNITKIRRKRTDSLPILQPEISPHFEVKSLGQDINLWLHPNDGILADYRIPIYHARYSETEAEKVKYTRRADLMKQFGKLYEDPTTSTSSVIDRDAYDRYTVNGHIGSENITIRTLPQHIADNHTRRRRNIDKLNNPTSNSYHHVAYKTTDVESLVINARFREPVVDTAEKTSLPDVLYPEILVIVDHSSYQYHENRNDIFDYLKYLVALWNGVDLKFRSLTNPSIRLYISGIVFSEDERATPYIYNNMLNPKTFNLSNALLGASSHFYSVNDTFPIDSYDIIAIITKLDMEDMVSDPKRPFSYRGTSFRTGVCHSQPKTKLVGGVAIFHDNGAFSGIHNAAHEIGHSMGAQDEIEIINCHSSDGYIMASPSVITENSADFSICSRRTFRLHFIRNNLMCLSNKPQVRALPTLMPGMLMNLTAQCYALGYSDPCHDEARICVRLHCFNKKGICTKTEISAVDGTKCDASSDKFCLKMQCVGL